MSNPNALRMLDPEPTCAVCRHAYERADIRIDGDDGSVTAAVECRVQPPVIRAGDPLDRGVWPVLAATKSCAWHDERGPLRPPITQWPPLS